VPLLPQVKRNPRYPGRPRLDDRKVLNGILFVLYTGIRFRRLRIRWEIRDDIHHAFVTLGCAIICWRRLGQERLRSSDQK
jgi:transposase